MRAYCILVAFVVLAASQALAQSQSRDNPTVRETLRWMQTSLESGSGDLWSGHETRSLRLEEFVGCEVHFSASTHQEPFANGEPAPDKKPTRIDYRFELGDIDPDNIAFSKGPENSIDLPSVITIRTRNDEKKITSTYSWLPKIGAKPDDSVVVLEVEAFGSDNEYVVRFATAFKHAVEDCGGKPSLFADAAKRGEVTRPVPGVAAAQTEPPRKDIPAIAKAAIGTVVSIVMSDKDGKPIGQGSGFVLSKDGIILTNYHVIAEGSSAIAKLPESASYVVDGVLAADKVRDLAVIKAHGENFRTVALGDSDRLQIGEEVVAIGNPLSLESTVSDGIISGVRTAESLGGKFLQITTPISPGSSGGPLFNMQGEVVGITTMYLEGGENLNFAIPVNDAKRMLRNQSAKLQDLPNEPDAEEARSKESPELPSTSHGVNSRAYGQYEELLKANDLTIMTGLYACFYDSEERSNSFFVIFASLINKNNMQALVYSFKDGVSEGSPLIFEGKIQQYSSKRGIFADLPTSYGYKQFDKSHAGDVFKWVAGDIAIETGWGQAMPGQVRIAYKVRMQHSTGNFVEDTELDFPGEDSKSDSTVHETGHCVRIPNVVKTPEEKFELEESPRNTPDIKGSSSQTGLAASPQNNPLPANTKIAATPADVTNATQEQIWEDIKYCFHNPANNLQVSDGALTSCREMNGAMAAREAECKSGSEAKTKKCKGFLKTYSDLKAGRL